MGRQLLSSISLLIASSGLLVAVRLATYCMAKNEKPKKGKVPEAQILRDVN